MAKKEYRPKADVAEGFTLTAQMGGDPESGGRVLDVSSWPYTTEDAHEQRILDGHDQITDRPPPSSAPKKEDR